MGARHRRGSGRAARITRLGVATATATAMAVTVAPPSAPPRPAVHANVDLSAAITVLPNHDQVPDLTGGVGTAIYDSSQAVADQLIRAIVNGVSLTAFAQAAGVDPQSLITGLLARIPASLLPGILDSLALEVPVLGPVLDGLNLDALTEILKGLGIAEVSDATLTGLLALVGLNLSDPLNLSGLAVPGLNVITTGPTFTTLKLLGLDLGWVPALPNSVADEINGSTYLELGADGLLNLVLQRVNEAAGGPVLGGILGTLGVSLGQVVGQLTDLIGDITGPAAGQIPDLIHVRITPTVGIGLGAFAAAMAYQKVIDDLENQPGGSAYAGLDPLLGSLTLLPMILLNNPARPNGGAAARFGAFAALLGINTVNPRTELTGDGGLAELPLGLHVGGANVLPVLVDATYEYQPLSDLASWPNAVSLVNNLAAGLSPTYMLRGLSLAGLDQQILDQVGTAVGGIGSGSLALNVYLTLPSKTLPLLEPLYLASDFLNLVGLGALAAIPMRLANALAPALSTLVNIGYTDVVRDANGNYTRTLKGAATETPFLSFPDIDYAKVPGDVIGQLINGFTKEFLSPNPTPATPNVLANLLSAVSGGGLDSVLGGVTPPAAPQTASLLSAGDLPSTTARLTPLTASVEEKPVVQTPVGAAKAGPETEDAFAAKQLGSDANTDVDAPKHAKSDGVEAPAAVSSTPPKHAKEDTDGQAGQDVEVAKDLPTSTKKPALNVVRDSLDASPAKADKGGAKAGSGKDTKTSESPGTATASETAPSASQDDAA